VGALAPSRAPLRLAYDAKLSSAVIDLSMRTVFAALGAALASASAS
jgi:hypothetical protein